MKAFRIILSLFLCVSMLFSLTVFAYADWWDAQKYFFRSLFDGSWYMDWSGTAEKYWEKWNDDGKSVTDSESYDAYVAEHYPLDCYGSDGTLYWYPSWNDTYTVQVWCGSYGTNPYSDSIPIFELSSVESGSYSWSFEVRDRSLLSTAFCNTSTNYYYELRIGGYVTYPISGTYKYYKSYGNKYITSSGVKGSSYYVTNDFNCGSVLPSRTVEVFNFVFSVVPSDTSIKNVYVQNTRVGAINNFNFVDKSQTNIYKNIQVVNETNNLYTNPATGEQNTINSWTYDYSTRTYHLTLDDGTKIDIEFGDNTLKIKLNGEVTEEYYYAEEKDTEPTPTPMPTPVDPTVTPTPTPGGTGGEVDPSPSPEPGPGGEDEPPDGFFEWLKQWLIDFKEWLGDWLDKLFHKDVTIDESDNSVHIEDNDDIDYDIYYTDDQGEQQQTSLRNILHKFGFLHDIYDLGRDMFTIVGADAAAAYAYDPGGTIDITPFLGDLRTVAAEDIMPIAGAPSLKLDLGAAQSHYGYEYGGEVEFLDLSWYTPYKQTVDSLLSGFLWILFIWHLFKLAPNIISGAGMVTGDLNDISRRRE